MVGGLGLAGGAVVATVAPGAIRVRFPPSTARDSFDFNAFLDPRASRTGKPGRSRGRHIRLGQSDGVPGRVVQMRDGYSGTPRNATPAAMYELLHKQFMEAR